MPTQVNMFSVLGDFQLYIDFGLAPNGMLQMMSWLILHDPIDKSVECRPWQLWFVIVGNFHPDHEHYHVKEIENIAIHTIPYDMEYIFGVIQDSIQYVWLLERGSVRRLHSEDCTEKTAQRSRSRSLPKLLCPDEKIPMWFYYCELRDEKIWENFLFISMREINVLWNVREVIARIDE